MTDDEIFRRYSESGYSTACPTERLSPRFRQHASDELEADPQSCLLENIGEAQYRLREATGRFFEAQADGLFERERFRAVSDEDKGRWVACMDNVRGDYQRARSDLDHWRSMASTWRGGKAPRSLRELAESKSTDEAVPLARGTR